MADGEDWNKSQHFEWQLENLRGAIRLAGQTIKSLEIINGGGAVGILTFYGNVLSKGSPSIPFNIPALLLALWCFGLGGGTAVLCSIFSYGSQRVVATNAKGEMVLFSLALLAGLISVALFISGAVSAGLSFG